LRTSVDVHNFLQDLDIPHELSRLRTPARGAEQLAAQLGLAPRQVVKVIFFFADQGPLAVLVPGDSMVDYQKLKKAAGTGSLRLAGPQEVQDLTGYLVGSTPPVAWEKDIPCHIDLQSLREEVVYAGGGEPNAVLKIRSYDLVRAADAEISDIIRRQ
jgi:Cys-tRNA(Pro)/Cys-tRNA(Cys) deacylase